MVKLPNVAPGEALSVSATMFTIFRACPDQALGRVHGDFPVDTRTSFKGNLAHRVFARHLRDGGLGSVGLDEACRQEIGHGMNMKLGAVGLKPSSLAGVIAEVGELYERFKQLPHDGFRRAEVFIEHEPSPGVTLRGSVDAVFDEPGVGVKLIDWKTGDLGRATDQLAFYALLWTLDTGALPDRVEAVSVATGERYAEIPDDESVSATAADVANLVAELRRALHFDVRLPRIAGGWCRWCPLLDSCDEGRSAASVFAT